MNPAEKIIKQMTNAGWHIDEKMLREDSCFYCKNYQMKGETIPYCSRFDFDTRPSAICKYFKEKKEILPPEATGQETVTTS